MKDNEDNHKEEVKVNKNGVNAKIKANILPDEDMRRIRFTDYNPETWYYFAYVEFPKEKRYRGFDITFNVTIPKNGDDIKIYVLDEDFLQPYDYQYFLSKNSKFEPAQIVFEFVEEQMKYLQKQGVLSGHIYGEYI